MMYFQNDKISIERHIRVNIGNVTIFVILSPIFFNKLIMEFLQIFKCIAVENIVFIKIIKLMNNSTLE